jgi:RimJ/RimL family protein N-acetyltransferase
MKTQNISVKEIQEQDVPHLVNYWTNASSDFLLAMGADPALVPDADSLREMLLGQIQKPYAEKQSYCIILRLDDEAIGHCNVNKIVFGEDASMHLHLWKENTRKTGLGTELVRKAIPYFFKNLQLKTVYSEPYALNPAPNKTLEKLGFRFVKEYVTIPGSLNFEQPVNRWELKRNDLEL